MKAEFISQEKADFMLREAVFALSDLVQTMASVVDDVDDPASFDSLVEAAKHLIDMIGYSRHLFGGPKA